jgi:hypothetical protein
MIDTTVHIDVELYEALSREAQRLKVSRVRLISSLLGHMSRRQRDYARAWTRVKYQARREKGSWRRLHVGLRGDEYEFFMDLKKVFKMSVSFIIAVAIKRYLNELSALMEKDNDSYRYRNYAMTQLMVGNITCWVLYWGIPPELLISPDPDH